MEFTLFAPTIDHVDLIGSWSDDAVPMRRGDDGVWRAAADLDDGRYQYRFRLPSRSPFLEGKTVDVADPKACLTDEWRGDASVIVVKDGQDVTTDPGFDWQHDDVPLQPNHRLTIYELHVGEFGYRGETSGTFDAVISRLDYLRDLGVTAVELMPVMTFPGNDSWGYNVRHPFALEASYGTPTEFKRLVDECHVRGIRVLLDIVFNHSEADSPLTQIDFDYWYRGEREGKPSYGPPFDFERHDGQLDVFPARRYALDQVAYWMETYHVDGFRLDATAVFDNFDLVAEVHTVAHRPSGGKPVYVVAEQLPEDPAIAGPHGPADGAWHQHFEHVVMDTLTSVAGSGATALMAVLQPANDGYVRPATVVNFVESHDEEAVVKRLRDAGFDDDAIFRRTKLAISLLFAAVGNPMLYQGQEFGGDRPRDPAIRPLQWNNLDDDHGLFLKEHVAFWARLRLDHDALTSPDLDAIHVHDADDVIAFRRGTGDGEALVVANLLDEDRPLSIPFPDGTWCQLVGESEIDSRGGTLNDVFDALGVKVYVHP